MKFIKYTIVLMFVSVFLTACTSMQQHSSSSVNVNTPQQLEHWVARGKMLIIHGKEKESAYYYWQQNKQDFHFVLSTFLGVDVFSLQFENGIATLKMDGKTYQDKSPQRLVARLTNKKIPFKHLPNWFLGTPNPALLSQPTYDLNNRIASFVYKENGFNPETWQVKYQGHQSVGQLTLPKSITINSNQSRIKMSVSSWQLKS